MFHIKTKKFTCSTKFSLGTITNTCVKLWNRQISDAHCHFIFTQTACKNHGTISLNNLQNIMQDEFINPLIGFKGPGYIHPEVVFSSTLTYYPCIWKASSQLLCISQFYKRNGPFPSEVYNFTEKINEIMHVSSTHQLREGGRGHLFLSLG